jgi:hypothetical protein
LRAAGGGGGGGRRHYPLRFTTKVVTFKADTVTGPGACVGPVMARSDRVAGVIEVALRGPGANIALMSTVAGVPCTGQGGRVRAPPTTQGGVRWVGGKLPRCARGPRTKNMHSSGEGKR